MHCRCLWSVVIVSVAVATSAAAQPASQSRLTWVTNGSVRAAAVHDQTLFIGGDFTRVAPAENFLGPVFGVSRTTGAALPTLPWADGAVFAIEPDGAGGYFVGGRFSQIGGIARAALAHVLSDGRVDPVFVPALEPAFDSQGDVSPILEVRALARVGGTLLVGGALRAGSGATSREGAAALDAITGAADAAFALPATLRAERFVVAGPRVFIMGRIQSLSPGDTAVVVAIAIAPGGTSWIRSLSYGGTIFDGVLAGGRLIVGGSFEYWTGTNWTHAAVSLDPASGAVDPSWTPISTYQSTDAPTVYAVTAIGSTVYLGGRFHRFGAFARSNLAAVDLVAGTVTAWAPDLPGTVWDLVPASESSVYAAGAFRLAGGTARDGIAEIDAAGAPTNWSPQAYSTEVRALQISGGSLLAGGTSAVSGGFPRDNLAAFRLDADDLLPWAPAAPSAVDDLATDGQRVFVGVARRNQPGQGLVPRIAVTAFEAGSGERSSWVAPDLTSGLVGLVGGQVYVSDHFGNVVRIDTTTGRADPSLLVRGRSVPRLVPDGELLYFYSLTDDGLVAIDADTGARSPWSPSFPGPAHQTVVSAAIMGQTVYVAHAHTRDLGQGLVAVDRDSAVILPFPASFDGRVQDLAVADGLVLAVGTPAARGGAAIAAFRPDGAAAGWNPPFTGVDYDARVNPAEKRRPTVRVLVTPSDIVVTSVQALAASPVHGIAVFSRQPPHAPSSLDATVLDNAVRLSWEAPVPVPSSYVIQVGSRAGASDVLVQDTASSVPVLDAVAPPGTYYVRVRSAGEHPVAAAAATNEIAVRVGCVAPRLPPTRLSATVTGTVVTLTWTAPAFIPVTRYVIEAGSERGQANLARLSVPGSQVSFTTPAPPGTYFVRVRGENACGSTPATPDIWITVGGDALPAAPTRLTVTDLTPDLAPGYSHSYLVEWSPVSGAIYYLLEAGSEPGLTNVVVTSTAGTTLGPAQVPWWATHYLRVRAVGAAGVGPPSGEFVLITFPPTPAAGVGVSRVEGSGR